MKTFSIFLALLLNIGGGTLRGQIAPNSPSDDYAPAFRRISGGCPELWFTSANSSKSGGNRSRQMMVAQCTKGGFSEPVPLADANINFIDSARSTTGGVLLNGVPSFTCDGTFGVFVSNRLVDGKDFGNDIYEMWENSDGKWDVRRIDEIDSNSWDDTPSLSEDGNILYFSSDRRAPGSRHTELFFARRLGIHQWSAPRPMEVLDNEPGNHEAPCAGPDGYFYYSTNLSGHYEIWRAPVGADGLPTSNGSPVPFADVNSSSSDQTHPAFSPGGNWLLFTSNRVSMGDADSGRTKDEDIYWVCMNPNPLGLLVHVQQQVRVRDSLSGLVYDKQLPLSTEVQFVGDQGNKTARSNEAGNCEVAFSRGKNPAADVCGYFLTLSPTAPNAHFVAPPATLRYTLDTRDTLLHMSLQAWDTTSINDSVYRQSFPIADVRFFIEGYWGPTTYRYRNYLMRSPRASCPTFFSDADCLAVGAQGVPCESNNLYHYSYDTVPSSSILKSGKRETEVHTLEYRAERADVDPCFDYEEFRKSGELYSGEVDAALDSLVANMRTALQNPRVLQAADSNQTIRITITGFTDPKNIHTYCDYSGETVDFARELVQMIDDNGNPATAVEKRFVTGEPMDFHGDGGNPLLSSLRAFWAATLMDSLWYHYVQEYANLRDRHLLVINAEGRSVKQVKQGKELTFAQRRSISVDITVTRSGIHIDSAKALPGQAVDLTNPCKPGLR